MFNFGSPEDAAELFLQSRLAMTGPAVADCYLDEMTEEEIRIAMAYLYGAIAEGLRQGLEPEAIEVLVGWYDQAFLALVDISDSFVDRFAAGAIIPPQGIGHRARYAAMAGLLSED